MNKNSFSLSRLPLSDLEEAAIWVMRNVVLPARESTDEDDEETIDG